MSTLASQVLMVRPSRFLANPQTLGSNHFQQLVPDAGAHHTLLAQQAFDGYVAALRAAGVQVQVLAQARQGHGCRIRLQRRTPCSPITGFPPTPTAR